eukprot:TRINITY_DN7102_c0_g1::TRINITY_DN7102_c0_g1_i2::g.19922::m.19922 TRINITY_DN7102_c0_g1::TRINITY_DN7102_c0_g1_i2::g.19922  ORF type:complete len:124 (-),score=2.42 TRINITY_DN7102_c0_g1_i2:201-572(-)
MQGADIEGGARGSHSHWHCLDTGCVRMRMIVCVRMCVRVLGSLMMCTCWPVICDGVIVEGCQCVRMSGFYTSEYTGPVVELARSGGVGFRRGTPPSTLNGCVTVIWACDFCACACACASATAC